MPHYRDVKTGEFLVDESGGTPQHERAVPPFLRFCRARGAADGLDAGSRGLSLLGEAQLDWRVDPRPVLAPFEHGIREVPGYRTLVRPDRDAVLSVVTSAYTVVENAELAGAVLELAARHDPGAALVGAAAFGRHDERTLFAVRVAEIARDEFLVLLVHNRHGGDGAARVLPVLYDARAAAVLTPPGTWSSEEIPHVGVVGRRLDDLARGPLVEKFLEEYEPAHRLLTEARWSPNRTQRLLHELWGDPPDLEPSTRDGRPLQPDDRAVRHPARHLTPALDACGTAMDAFRRLCAFVDNESEACDRGDVTRDRDERLALGAGTRLKHRAWRWLAGATR